MTEKRFAVTVVILATLIMIAYSYISAYLYSETTEQWSSSPSRIRCGLSSRLYWHGYPILPLAPRRFPALRSPHSVYSFISPYTFIRLTIPKVAAPFG